MPGGSGATGAFSTDLPCLLVSGQTRPSNKLPVSSRGSNAHLPGRLGRCCKQAMARTSQAWDLHAPYPVEQSSPFRLESQLPAATFTLQSCLRFHLGCCASAVWTLHRANVSHNGNSPGFRLPSGLGHRCNYVLVRCHMHFWFHDAEGELAE